MKQLSQKQLDFPETINWNEVQNITGSEVGEILSRNVMIDLMTKDRNLVPGLRAAINILYDYLEDKGKL